MNNLYYLSIDIPWETFRQARCFSSFSLDSFPLTVCFSYLSVQQVKLGSPDYIDCNTEEVIEDFMKRIKCYENSYQPLDEVLDR